MKAMMLLTVFLGFLSIGFNAFSETGYKRSAWGSKKWHGPGVPPHFSSQQPGGNVPADPEWGIRPPGHRPGPWGRVYYYEKPSAETIIIEKERQEPAYKPAAPPRKQLSPVRCGGRTLSRTDPVTGELIIEYISSSRECPE